MQKDLLNSYGKYFKNDEVVLDSYSLVDGVYVKIGQDGKIIDKLILDKKDKESLSKNDIYEWFKKRDFYSTVLAMNKSITTDIKEIDYYKTGKKMMSNNYLTLFFKSNNTDILNEEEKAEVLPLEIFKKVIEKYYKSLEEIEKTNIGEIEIHEINIDKFNKCKEIYLSNIENILKELKNENLKKGTRIKLYLDDTIENYEKASLKYFTLKIFNKETFNKYFNGELYGANNYNFSMNSKKPYNWLKTTSYKIPSRVKFEEINTIKNMYIWLLKNVNNFREERMPLEFDFKGDFRNKKSQEMFLLKVDNDNGNALISNFEYIPKYTNDMKEIVFKNYINSLYLKDFECQILKINELEKFINSNWFSGVMRSDSVNSLKVDDCYKIFVEKYSKFFTEFFDKINDEPIKRNLDKMGLDITKRILYNELQKEIPKSKKSENLEDNEQKKETVKTRKFYNTTKSLIIYLSLKEYFFGNGGEELENKIDILRNAAKEIINSKRHISNDEEFCFLLGQISYYLLSHSKASKLNQDVFAPIINASKLEAVKEELKILYKKYQHEIRLRNNERFNTALSEVLAYKTDKRLKENETILLIGFLSDNLFYMKKGESKDYENE